MCINEADATSHDSVLLNEEENLVVAGARSVGQCVQKGDNALPVFKVPTGELSYDKSMHKDLFLLEQLGELSAGRPEVINPDRRVDQYH